MRKVTISFVMSVRVSAWNSSAPTGRIFMKFHIWLFFWTSVEKIQALLKADKNNEYFTWRQIYILIISRSVLLRMKNVSEKSYIENQNTHFTFYNFFFSENRSIYEIIVSKGLPRQAEVAQGFPGSLRPRIFLTFRHYKFGRSSAQRTGRLYPSINPWCSLSEAESTSGHMVLSGGPGKKSPVTPPGIDPGTFRPVAQCLNHYATPGHLWNNMEKY